MPISKCKALCSLQLLFTKHFINSILSPILPRPDKTFNLRLLIAKKLCKLTIKLLISRFLKEERIIFNTFQITGQFQIISDIL